MADLTWPVGISPESFRLQLYSSTFRVKSLFGRTGQTINMLNDRWVCDLSVGKLSTVDGAVMEGLCSSLRKGATLIELGHFYRPTPLGTLQGTTTTVGSASMGAASLTLAATTGLTLLAGDYFSVAGLLLQVAANCTAASSQIVVPITVRLRKPVAASSVVILSNPVCRFRLTPGTMPDVNYGVNSVQQGVSLSFVEAIL